MSRMVIDDVMWKKLSNLLPKLKGRHGKDDRLFLEVEYDTHFYKERNVIERFFNRIKHFRRVATRYDKTALMFLGALTLTGILIWLKL